MILTFFPALHTLSALPFRGAGESEILQMIAHAGPMVKFVLFSLLAFSVASWAIIFMKARFLRRAKQETEYFLDLFWDGTEFSKLNSECDELPFSPIVALFKAGFSELKHIRKMQALPSGDANSNMHYMMESMERSLRKTAIDQGSRLEKAVSFLATTGNTTPFIGLFGTVWGIMESFRSIGMKGSANLAVVAPGISEALIATAAGLAAAIPAVVAFNHFSQKVSVMRSEMDTFMSDLMGLVERQLLRKQVSSRED